MEVRENGMKLPVEEFPLVVLCSRKIVSEYASEYKLLGNDTKGVG